MADAQKQAVKAAEKEARSAKWAQRKQAFAQLWQAFNIQRKQDKQLIPLMLLALIGIAAAFFLIGLIFHMQWLLLPIGIAFGIVAALFIFTRRLERSVYERASDQPGAAGWALENMRNGRGHGVENQSCCSRHYAYGRGASRRGLCGIVWLAKVNRVASAR